MLGNGFTKQSRLKVQVSHSTFYPEGSDLAYRAFSVGASSATETYFLQSQWIVLPSGEAIPLDESLCSDHEICTSLTPMPFLLSPKTQCTAMISGKRLLEALLSRHSEGVVPLIVLLVDSTGAFHCSEPHEFDMDEPTTWRPTPEQQEYRRAVEQRMLAQK